MAYRVLADHGDRRLVTAAHTRHPLYPDTLPEPSLECLHQRIGAKDLTTERITDSYCQRRWRPFTFADNVKMMVKSRNLVDFGRRQPQYIRKRHNMRCRYMAETILQSMQIFDQLITPTRQSTDGVKHSSLGHRVYTVALAATSQTVAFGVTGNHGRCIFLDSIACLTHTLATRNGINDSL